MNWKTLINLFESSNGSLRVTIFLINLSTIVVTNKTKINNNKFATVKSIVLVSINLNFSISKAGTSWINSYFGGEGLVCRFKGKGTVWCQSHNDNSFGFTLTPGLTPR